MAERYMAAFCDVPFYVDGVYYEPPDEVVITHRAWRRYTCPPGCGACCHSFELIFLPEEFAEFEYVYPEHAKRFQRFEVLRQVDGYYRTIHLYRDSQDDAETRRCMYLNLENGRCGIHLRNPFHCAIELLRFTRRDTKRGTVVHVGTQLFGRTWALERIDGERGAMCEVLDPDPQRIIEVESHLQYIVRWMDYFGIPVMQAIRNFRYHPDYMHKDVVLTRKSDAPRLETPPKDYNPGVEITTQQLVPLRMGKGFVRVEEDRVRDGSTPPAKPRVGVWQYL